MAFPVVDPETGLEAIAEEDDEEATAMKTWWPRNHRGKQRVLGFALFGLGLAAAVVGGVCGHDSGQCSRRRPRSMPPPTINTTMTTSLTPKTTQPVLVTRMPQQPAEMPSPAPSLAPNDVPSIQPSDVLSAQPSGIPTVPPTESPPIVRVVPSTLPTNVPTSAPSVRPTPKTTPTKHRPTTNAPTETTMPVVSAIEDCTLVGCYLRNLNNGTETLLALAAPTSYSVLQNGSASTSTTSSSSRYSIRCDTSDNVVFVDFFLYLGIVESSSDAAVAAAAFYQREHEAPFWMKANGGNWIEPVPQLSACEDHHNSSSSSSIIIKTVRVALATDEDEPQDYCLDVSFQLKCARQ
jgi:hypothetical protein